MSTLYSCINCGVDVEENAPTLYDSDLGCDMPHCYICHEVIRQHSTQFDEFHDALGYAEGCDMKNIAALPLGIGMFACTIAKLIDPDVNVVTHHPHAFYNLRTSHVGFDHGGKACPTAEVAHRFDRLMNMWSPALCEPIQGDGYTIDPTPDVDRWIKSLLDIHPWQDGNGRTASILRNWMLNQLHNPVPLPYYAF